MQPYLLKIPLQRKDPEVHFEACQVDHVHTLSESEFRFFQHNLMLEHDFLRISKQMIVNIRMIRSLRSEINRKIRITLKNDEQIIVSRMYSDELRRKLGLK